MPIYIIQSRTPKMVSDFIDAAGITGNVQFQALNNLYRNLIGRGLQSDYDFIGNNIITAFYPYCPKTDSTADSTSCKYNFVDVNNFEITFTNFVAGDFVATGVTGGTGKYALTGITPSTHLSLNDIAIDVYCRTNILVTARPFGSESAANNRLSSTLRTIGDLNNIRMSDATNLSVSNTNSIGLYNFKRSGANAREIIKGNVSIASDTEVSTSLSTAEMVLHALNVSSVISQYDTRQYGLFCFRKSLSSTNYTKLYNTFLTYNSEIITGGR